MVISFLKIFLKSVCLAEKKCYGAPPTFIRGLKLPPLVIYQYDVIGNIAWDINNTRKPGWRHSPSWTANCDISSKCLLRNSVMLRRAFCTKHLRIMVDMLLVNPGTRRRVENIENAYKQPKTPCLYDPLVPENHFFIPCFPFCRK